jgi:hypothetical protein
MPRMLVRSLSSLVPSLAHSAFRIGGVLVDQTSSAQQNSPGGLLDLSRTARPPWDVAVVCVDHPVRKYVSVGQHRTLWQFLRIAERVMAAFLSTQLAAGKRLAG